MLSALGISPTVRKDVRLELELERPRYEAQQNRNMIRTVVAAVDDMFFVSKIRETGKALGMIVKFPRTADALRATLHEELPGLIVVDLHNQKLNPIELATELKSDDRLRSIPLLGFFSHVQADLQRQALEAGYNEVIPRSLFARDLASILAGEQKV